MEIDNKKLMDQQKSRSMTIIVRYPEYYPTKNDMKDKLLWESYAPSKGLLYSPYQKIQQAP